MFGFRCMLDLQLLTIYRFLRHHLSRLKGRVLDVGAGEGPWRAMLKHAEYVGVDVEVAPEFGMRRKPDITYYDGITLPFEAESFDGVLCTEVLEHVPEPAPFLIDLNRVLRSGGSLVLTVPWSARLHYLPHDYGRFTRFGLTLMLQSAGFTSIVIEERGNDVAVIANKLLVVTVRMLRPRSLIQVIWTWPLALVLSPLTVVALVAAHVAMRFHLGSSEDPLGYGVTAIKCMSNPRPATPSASATETSPLRSDKS